MSRTAPLFGRIVVTIGRIEAITGLHIGAADTDFDIGTRDKLVLRDPLTQQPYIPGSSLRGKMRSLLEKAYQLPQNQKINKGYIHVCKKADDFQQCPVCPVFGIPAPETGTAWGDTVTLTRLIVRDVFLTDESAARLEGAHTDGLYTEFKTEVAIDRVTSIANPRTIERVPAGAVFGPAELIYSVYEVPKDLDRFVQVLTALQLLEDDYLGGHGSRGYGKVAFKDITLTARRAPDYTKVKPIATFADLAEWTKKKGQVQKALAEFFATKDDAQTSANGG